MSAGGSKTLPHSWENDSRKSGVIIVTGPWGNAECGLAPRTTRKGCTRSLSEGEIKTSNIWVCVFKGENHTSWLSCFLMWNALVIKYLYVANNKPLHLFVSIFVSHYLQTNPSLKWGQMTLSSHYNKTCLSNYQENPCLQAVWSTRLIHGGLQATFNMLAFFQQQISTCWALFYPFSWKQLQQDNKQFQIINLFWITLLSHDSLVLIKSLNLFSRYWKG